MSTAIFHLMKRSQNFNVFSKNSLYFSNKIYFTNRIFLQPSLIHLKYCKNESSNESSNENIADSFDFSSLSDNNSKKPAQEVNDPQGAYHLVSSSEYENEMNLSDLQDSGADGSHSDSVGNTSSMTFDSDENSSQSDQRFARNTFPEDEFYSKDLVRKLFVGQEEDLVDEVYNEYEEDPLAFDVSDSELDKEESESEPSSESDKHDIDSEGEGFDNTAPAMVDDESSDPEDWDSEYAKTVVDYSHNLKVPEDVIGKVLVFDDITMQQMLPEGLCGDVYHELPVIEKKIGKKPKPGFLVREACLEVIQRLKDHQQNKFKPYRDPKTKEMLNPHTILEGETMVGKSNILNAAICWARQNGWIVMVIRDGLDITRVDSIDSNISESNYDEDKFDQPTIAHRMCKGYVTAHGEQLKNIPLRTKFRITNVARSDPQHLRTKDTSYNEEADESVVLETLYDLVMLGGANDSLDCKILASDCVRIFRQELSLVTEYPVLMVADHINAFYHYTYIGNPNNMDHLIPKTLKPEQLTLANISKNFRDHRILNGTFLTSIGGTFMKTKSIPVWRAMFPQKKNVIEIPRMTHKEFHQYSIYYSYTGFSTHVPTATTKFLYHFCGRGKGQEYFVILRSQPVFEERVAPKEADVLKKGSREDQVKKDAIEELQDGDALHISDLFERQPLNANP